MTATIVREHTINGTTWRIVTDDAVGVMWLALESEDGTRGVAIHGRPEDILPIASTLEDAASAMVGTAERAEFVRQRASERRAA